MTVRYQKGRPSQVAELKVEWGVKWGDGTIILVEGAERPLNRPGEAIHIGETVVQGDELEWHRRRVVVSEWE